MTNKINNTTAPILNKITTYETAQKKEDNTKIQDSNKMSAKVSDSIDLSETARLMSIVKQEIDMIEKQEEQGIFSEDRNEKIAMLKKQIEEGTYQINTLEVAKKIIMEESSSI